MRQPFRDLVWLFRGGPPPGPAIIETYYDGILNRD